MKKDIRDIRIDLYNTVLFSPYSRIIDTEDKLNLLKEIDDKAFPVFTGDISDGSHSFNELYYQRCMLFAALVNTFKDSAWKTYRHEDGGLCFGGGWFLVCIETPEGPYSYHYENKYWDLFKCKELEVAKPFDGHTEKDVTRLLSL